MALGIWINLLLTLLLGMSSPMIRAEEPQKQRPLILAVVNKVELLQPSRSLPQPSHNYRVRGHRGVTQRNRLGDLCQR
jgi:hypothetical protein